MRHDFVSLKIFVSIAECLNLTRAAEREHLAVSAVSKRVAELEAMVGTPLLHRQPRGVILTPAGQSLLRYARQVMLLLGQADAELGEYSGGVKGHLRIHAVASALIQFLPEDIESFLQRHPQIRFDIEEGTGRQVATAVLDGTADLGVVTSAVSIPGLSSVPYRVDHLMLGVPDGHVLAGLERVDFRRAAEFPFVGPHNESSLADLMSSAARDLGVHLQQRVRASSFDAMCRMVEAGLGIVVLPEQVLRRQAQVGRLQVVPLDAAWAQRTLHVIVRQADQPGPLTATFVAHLCQSMPSAAE